MTTQTHDIAGMCKEIADQQQEIARLQAQVDAMADALVSAESALSDIGDADREPGDDLHWCENRAAEALPAVRAALAAIGALT